MKWQLSLGPYRGEVIDFNPTKLRLFSIENLPLALVQVIYKGAKNIPLEEVVCIFDADQVTKLEFYC